MTQQDSAIVATAVPLRGLAWAALGVAAFSVSFPATVLALRGFDPLFVGAGRSVFAAALAGPAMLVARAPIPARRQVPGLLVVATGCGIGFGLLTAVALHTVTASHAAVVGALLPAVTAVAAVVRSGERPSPLFWFAALGGAAAVSVFALRQGVGELKAADALLLLALLLAGTGYAEGGRLAREMPGWQVVSWGVLLALPVSLPLLLVATIAHPPHPSAEAIAGLGYVSAISMFVGFFPWYRGLARAGIARASQLQLAQPFLTLAISTVLLGEHPGNDALVTAVVVIACVVATQRARQRRVAPIAPTPGLRAQRTMEGRVPRSPGSARSTTGSSAAVSRGRSARPSRPPTSTSSGAGCQGGDHG